MSISRYVRTLLPSFGKADLEKRIANLRRELNEDTLPPLSAANDVLKDHAFKDRFLLRVDNTATRVLNKRYRGNYINKLHAVIEKANDNLSLLERTLAKHKSRDIVIAGITYSQLHFFQLLDAITFVSKYTRTLLIYTLAVETDMLRQNRNVNYRMSKAEISMLKEKMEPYFSALKAIDHTEKDLEGLLKQVPEIEIDPENIDVDVAAVGASNLDPFGLVVQGIILNPVYHVRIAISDWEDHRRQAAKEERVTLQYQILDMKAALEQKEDANLRRALEYQEKRLAELNYKIAKMEEV